MKNMKKTYLGLLLTFVLVALTACGGNDSSEDNKETESEQTKVEETKLEEAKDKKQHLVDKGASLSKGPNSEINYKFDGDVAIFEKKENDKLALRIYVAHKGEQITSLGMVVVTYYEDANIDPNSKDDIEGIDNLLTGTLFAGKIGIESEIEKYDDHYDFIMIFDLTKIDPKDAILFSDLPEITSFNDFSKSLEEEMGVVRVK